MVANGNAGICSERFVCQIPWANNFPVPDGFFPVRYWVHANASVFFKNGGQWAKNKSTWYTYRAVDTRLRSAGRGIYLCCLFAACRRNGVGIFSHTIYHRYCRYLLAGNRKWSPMDCHRGWLCGCCRYGAARRSNRPGRFYRYRGCLHFRYC